MVPVRPDSPAITVNAATLALMPEDVREAFLAFFDATQIEAGEREREKDIRYLDELADCMGRQPGWEEVVWEDDGERPTFRQFYGDLYGVDTGSSGFQLAVPVLANHRDREHPFQTYSDFKEFSDAIMGMEDMFIYLGDFWTPPTGFSTARLNAMTTIRGFCVDIDQGWVDPQKTIPLRSPESVTYVLMRAFSEAPFLRPNYILLSGHGIQLWYVFEHPIRLYRKTSPRRKKYRDLLEQIYRWFSENLPPNQVHVDMSCPPINHAFRAPGSVTKFKVPSRLFCYQGTDREMIDPLVLSGFLDAGLRPLDVVDLTEEEYAKAKAERINRRQEPATEKQLEYLAFLKAEGCVEVDDGPLTKGEAGELIRRGVEIFEQTCGVNSAKVTISSLNNIKLKPRSPKLYEATLRGIKEKTQAGTRYNAMFGLAGLAYNCQIPKEQLEDDLFGLMNSPEFGSARGRDGKPLQAEDVRAALLGYNVLGALRRREHLEYRLGWEFEKSKRNGRKQYNHLHDEFIYDNGKKKKNPCRDNRLLNAGAPTKRQLVQDYAAAHPEANHTQIAAALGVSRPTVIKWLKSNNE